MGKACSIVITLKYTGPKAYMYNIKGNISGKTGTRTLNLYVSFQCYKICEQFQLLVDTQELCRKAFVVSKLSSKNES